MAEFIKFDEYELIEIFCSFPSYINNEKKIYHYSYSDRYGFSLSMIIKGYDKSIEINLKLNDFTKNIFDFCFKNVESLNKRSDGTLVINLVQDKKIIIYFDPSIGIRYEADNLEYFETDITDVLKI